jgi:hypothetical protein
MTSTMIEGPTGTIFVPALGFAFRRGTIGAEAARG